MESVIFKRIIKTIYDEKRSELPIQDLLISVYYLQANWDGEDLKADGVYKTLRKDISVLINDELIEKFDRIKESLTEGKTQNLTAERIIANHKNQFKPEDMLSNGFERVFIGPSPTMAEKTLVDFQNSFDEPVRMDELYVSITQWDRQKTQDVVHFSENLYDYVRARMRGVPTNRKDNL